jgi:hypothetical protein
MPKYMFAWMDFHGSRVMDSHVIDPDFDDADYSDIVMRRAIMTNFNDEMFRHIDSKAIGKAKSYARRRKAKAAMAEYSRKYPVI